VSGSVRRSARSVECLALLTRNYKDRGRTNMAKASWLFVVFGEPERSREVFRY
jgi:hypothetical protein